MQKIYYVPAIYAVLTQLALIVLLIVRLSRRRKSESRLRELNRHLMQAQEEERKRIARELHDDVAQRLALVKINFETTMQEDLSLKSAPMQSRLQSILAEIDELSSDIQHLSHRLHSVKLEYLGLKAALKDLCRQIEKQYHIVIDLRADDPAKTVPREAELCIYRVAQEALHNVVKHSGADKAAVQLVDQGRVLRLEVSDNGKGFSQAETLPGLGLASMRERLSILDGSLQVRSTPGRGAVLSAQIPYPGTTASPSGGF